MNLYAHALNNPITKIDLYGLQGAENLHWPHTNFLYPPPQDPVNTQAKEALLCFVTGGSRSFVFGPDEAWTQRLQQHPHMNSVRLRIKLEMSNHCAGKEARLSGWHSFDQQTLPFWDKASWLVNDLLSWGTDGAFGTDPAFRFGSFRLSWKVRMHHCCCKAAIVIFHASDDLRAQSASREPFTGIPLIPIDQPLGPGLPLQNVPILWTWEEFIEF